MADGSNRAETTPPARERSGVDSIAEELAARIEDLPGEGDAVDWAATAATCEREAAERGPGREAALLLHQSGRIHEERLGSPEVALAYYEGALALDPTHLPSLQAARRIAAAWGYATRECRFLEAEARVTPDPARAAELDYARARLLAGALGKPEEARALLAEAATRHPTHLPLLSDHGRLSAAHAPEALLADWRRAAEIADDATAAQLLCAASHLAAERLGRPDEAAELALAAFRRCPADPGARALALRHAERRGQDDDRAAMLAAEGREASTPRAAALALLQLARAEEERGRPEQALEALTEARRRAPADPAVLRERARLAERREAWGELCEVLRARAEMHRPESGGDPAERVAALLQLADVTDQRLGQPDAAAACWREARLLQPGNRTALSALGRYHARRGEWEQVLETFLAERDAADDPRERAQRCFKAGELLEERLARPDEAAALYGEALAHDRTLLSAARAQERLLTRLGRVEELAALLESELGASTDPGQQIALLFRLAQLREDRLGDLDGAADCYRRALEVDPGHLLALRSLAVVLDRAGKRAELAVALEHAAAVVKDPPQVVDLLTRAGEVRDEAGDEAGAAAAWERALAIDPAHLPALRSLGSLCARAGRWEELVDMCRAEAQALPSAEAAAALLVRVGEILEDKLERPAEAMAAWREALTLSPAHPRALASLARLHRTRGELEPLVEVLRADADARTSSTERAALLAEVAEVHERQLHDPVAAAEVHEEALRADPGFAPSRRALHRLLAAAERWPELAQALRSEADATEGPERSAALLELAWLQAERLGDPEAAERTCREIRSAEPAHVGAGLLLDRLGAAPDAAARAGQASLVSDPAVARPLWVASALDLRVAGADPSPALERAAALDPSDPVAGPAMEGQLRAQGRFADLALHWEAREKTDGDGESRAECALRAAEAWDDAGDRERSRAAIDRCLRLTPDALPAWQALRRHHLRCGDWAGVRHALQAEAARSRDARSAVAALSQAAAVAQSRLGDPRGAVEDLRSALERDPLDAALAARLVDLLHGSESAADLCALREARARAARGPVEAAEEWLAAARVAAGPLQDPDRALEAVDQAVALRPSWQEALLERARLLASVPGRAADAARDLGACLTLGGEPAALAPVHLELAALHQGPLGDAPRAMSHLNAVLASAPENVEALTRLARIHREAQNWPAAADALRRLVSTQALSGDEQVPRLLELAEVRAEGFDDAPAAAELCERALDLAPGHAPALDLLVRVREKAEDVPGLVTALIRAGREGKDGARRGSARMRAARLLAERLGDPVQAAELLRQAIAEEPGSIPAREQLAELLAQGEPERAAEEQRLILDLDPARVETWHSLYRLFQRSRAHDRAFVAASVLRFLQAADAGEAAFLAETTPQAPRLSAQTVGPDEWEALRHPLDRGPLSELMALAGEHLGRLLPAPAEAPRLKGSHPVRRQLEELARNLDVRDFTLLEGGEGAALALDPTPADQARVGGEFQRRHGPAEQRFLLARVAARLRARNGLADHLGPGRLGEFLAATVRQVAGNWSATGDPGEGLVKQVAKVLPRRTRRAVEELAGRLAPLEVDLIAWYASMSGTADRAGLLLCGDVTAALQLVLRDGAPAPPRPEPATDVREAVRTRPDLQELLRFAASDEHFRLRQRLRMAIA
ncbi:MAG: tetratricopeptide repeat protein [Deltaproteobacteria bacterium]|nr:tetratricopeptide repeat protein [Deltaproteobacteria bacterium]